ncbi:exosome complex protein Rrp42 [Candidatus Woesearchaeota archaeon]|nr:exosome complex protein Rrp42 [Candidatus Woesearchaeota archaeon]
MNNVRKDHLLATLAKGVRYDGRSFQEYRPISIEYKISSKSAEGSARVKIGKTEVVAGVKLEIGEPYPDTPNEGTLMVNVELLPLSSPEFESGPPGIDAMELSRVVDRVLREGEALDFEKLCIESGKKMWIVIVDIYPINDDGNLFDAAALAALAALRDTHFPAVADEKVHYGKLTTTKLPLKHLPLSCTIVKTGDAFLADPSRVEREFEDARLTVGVLKDNMICALQKGGDAGLTPEEIHHMIALAQEKTQELRRLFP